MVNGVPPELMALMAGKMNPQPPEPPPDPIPVAPAGIAPMDQTIRAQPLPPPPDMGNPIDLLGPKPLLREGAFGLWPEEPDDAPDEGPIYPLWYKPESRLKTGDIQRVAERERERHMLWIERVRRDLQRYLMREVGVFKDFNADAEEEFQSSTLVNEVNLGATYMSTVPVTYKPIWVNPEDLDEAQKKSDLLSHLRRKAIRQHSRAGRGLLERDEPLMLLVYGCIVSHSCIDLEDLDNPIRHELLDPLTCFPRFEGNRGMSQMVRIYETTTRELNEKFGGKNGTVKTRLRSVARNADKTVKNRTQNESIDDDDEYVVEVVEWWNRTWRVVIAAGVEVFSGQHDYGFVPFVYKMNPLGLPAFVRNPSHRSGADPFALGSFDALDTARDRADQGLAHFHFQKSTHDQKEAILGLLYTAIGSANNPALMITQGPYSQEQGAPIMSPRKGARNLLREDEQVAPYPTAPSNNQLNPVLQAIGQDIQTGFAGPVEYGAGADGLASAASVESLAEIGRSRFATEMKTLEEYHAEVAEMWLRLIRDFGHLLGPDGKKGQFAVPNTDMGFGHSPVHMITVEELRETGISCEARMEYIPPAILMQLGTAVRTWNEMGGMSIREGIELRGGRNASRTIQEAIIEKALQSDLAKDLVLLNALQAEGADPQVIATIQQRIQQSGPGGGGQQGGTNGPPSPLAGIAQAGSNPLIGMGPGPAANPGPQAGAANAGAPPNAGLGGPSIPGLG